MLLLSVYLLLLFLFTISFSSWTASTAKENIVFQLKELIASFPSSSICPPTTACFSWSICCADWAMNPHWWDWGVFGVNISTKSWVCSYSAGLYLLITSNSLVNVLSLKFNHLSLEDEKEGAVKTVEVNVIDAFCDSLISQYKEKY